MIKHKTEKICHKKQQRKEKTSAESKTYTVCMLGLFLDNFAMSPVIHKGNKIIIFSAFFLEILPAEAGQAVLMIFEDNKQGVTVKAKL